MAYLRLCLLVFSALAIFNGSAVAAVDILLSPATDSSVGDSSVEDGTVEAGTRKISAFFMNQGSETESLEVPQTIPCTLEINGVSHVLSMESVSHEAAPFSIAPGGFFRRDYVIHVPDCPSGVARIIPRHPAASEVLIAVAAHGEHKKSATPSASNLAYSVEEASTDDGQTDQADASEDQERQSKTSLTDNSADKEDTPLSYVIKNLSTYKPMYFIYGANPAEAKFQLSFKYRLLNPEGSWAGSLPWLSGFHIAYTQTSWWDMDALSKPFKDSSYMPEFFWENPDLGFSTPDWIESVGVRTGIQHESNGKAGDDSRSLNIAYVEPLLEFPLPWDFNLTVAPKVWTYIMDLSDNADIARYRGYFDLRMTVGQDDGIQLSTNLRKGTDEGKGSIQLDLTYPLAKLTDDNLGLYLQAQFFDGYAESLIDYEEAHTSFYLGVAVSRW